jgi:hypothetical protein
MRAFTFAVAVVALTASTASAQTQPTQLAALREFAKATGYKKWVNKWPVDLTASDPCVAPTWAGITCSAAGGPNIVAISLPDNKLVGTIPASFTALSFLTSLNLAGNKKVKPAGFANIKSAPLVNLDLSNNVVRKFPLTAITAAAANLQTLNLSKAAIKGTIPASFSTLTALTKLNVAGNALTGNVPSAFSVLKTNLKIVDVRKNKLSGPIPTALSVIFFKNAAPGSVTEFNICGNSKSFVLPSPIFKGDGTTANSVVSC